MLYKLHTIQKRTGSCIASSDAAGERITQMLDERGNHPSGVIKRSLLTYYCIVEGRLAS
jgi:hypothetical protein